MELNYNNALSANLLNGQLPESGAKATSILHFGVGGFHRAHQAWALQNMHNQHEAGFENWSISGVCILPGDMPFVEAFRRQDCLYFVQSFSAGGRRLDSLISSIKEILHPANDYPAILDRIASKETKVISFTITEGGYNVDYRSHTFMWETITVQEDLKKTGHPQTVFRILAEGLRKRMESGGGGIVLMSCDNVQHNGDILKFALLEFLNEFDHALTTWVEENVSFVKTMVDRITPATSQKQKIDFASKHKVDDNCLVVCEDFFQWVIQKDPRLLNLPYTKMGATLVDDVEPHEKMKLRLLNGGHSLTGLLGYVLGYDRIHTSINDELIRAVYQRYCDEEVIPTLDYIKDLRYQDYVMELISRFSNPMINDSTIRIISGSTDKLPKFVLPVIQDQLAGNDPHIKWGVLILAAWYCYLENEYQKDQMAQVTDLNRGLLLEIFKVPGFHAADFIDKIPEIAALDDKGIVRQLFVYYVEGLSQTDVNRQRIFIQQLLEVEA